MATERVTSRTRRAERRREAVREIREELERIRRSEARVAEALGSARAARQRVEELVRGLAIDDDGVRDIVRQELRAVGDGAPLASDDAASTPPSDSFAAPLAPAGSTRSGDDSPDAPDEEDEQEVEEDTKRSYRLVGVAALSVLAVAAAGWFGIRAFAGDEQPATLTVGGDSALPLGGPVAAANGVLETAPPSAESATAAKPQEVEDRFFSLLPEGAPQRAAVYDSLWEAHSPAFTPLFARVDSATRDDTVKRALEAWRTGSLTALQRDLLHSALVQLSLRDEMGAALAVDGQLLRNPCRGAACNALLNFWETRGEGYGLPPVPDDAPSNTEALHTAENVLVLRTMQSLHRARETNGR